MALGGCRKTEEVPETSQEETGDRLQIGLSFESYVIERWIRERDVFVSAAKELGADVLSIITPSFAAASQEELIQAL